MIALLGASGYIGTAFRRQLDAGGIDYVALPRAQCNCHDRDAMARLLRKLAPEFLINAAGLTGRPNVDTCELQKSDCLAANSVLPGQLRAICEQLRLPWGHVSSGCIYTGSREGGAGYRESDPPNFTFRQNNCSFYSGCKALGEEVLLGARQCYIWRLRIPFNHIDCPRNYLTKVMRYDRLLDVPNSMSHLDQFVTACLDCWQGKLPYGIYNLVNSGAITTREVVEIITNHGITAKKFRFFASEREFMCAAARTPRSSCILDNSKAIAAGLVLPDVREAICMSLSTWKHTATVA
jgi:dTDP-4-dehydrorhamnose reductase